MRSTLTAQGKRYLDALDTLSQDERDLVLQSLENIAGAKMPDATTESLVESISGRRFSKADRIKLEVETLERHFLHRRQLLENALTAPQVAKLLGTSRQTPHDRVSSQTLLAIKENGKLCFPSWQFDPEGPDGVIDGLPAVLKALTMSDYSKLNWLTRANPYLEGLTAAQALKAGQKDRVLQQAETAGASQWS